MPVLLLCLGLLLLCLPATAQNRPLPPEDQRAAPGRPGWFVEQRAGGWIWLADPHPVSTATWSGDCAADGRAAGQGSLELRIGDATYLIEGTYRDGRRNGQGVLLWPNGNRYDGQFRDGLPDGRGEGIIDGIRHAGTWTAGCFRENDRRTRS